MSYIDTVTLHCRTNSFIFKYITPNDAGITKSHQAGFHLPKTSWQLFFEHEGKKGDFLEKPIKITWKSEDGLETDTSSSFKYYGRRTRNEYRLTRVGKEFPFRNGNYLGSLLVISKSGDHYQAWIISSEDNINHFLEYFGISPLDTGRYINPDKSLFLFNNEPIKFSEQKIFEELLTPFPENFPSGKEMCQYSVDITNMVYGNISNNDDLLLKRLDTEYKLYQYIETGLFEPKLKAASNSINDFLKLSLSIQNKRKARAGQSLENHLKVIFNENKIRYTSNGITEGNKKPDFIFPGIKEYHDNKFPADRLVFLGAKTSCKDRWRQILVEADRIRKKHLITLEQGISLNQINEMRCKDVQLVIPKDFLPMYPQQVRDSIMTLNNFIEYVQEKQSESG